MRFVASINKSSIKQIMAYMGIFAEIFVYFWP